MLALNHSNANKTRWIPKAPTQAQSDGNMSLASGGPEHKIRSRSRGPVGSFVNGLVHSLHSLGHTSPGREKNNTDGKFIPHGLFSTHNSTQPCQEHRTFPEAMTSYRSDQHGQPTVSEQERLSAESSRNFTNPDPSHRPSISPIPPPLKTKALPPEPSPIRLSQDSCQNEYRAPRCVGPVPRMVARGVLEIDAIPQMELLKVLAMLLEQIAASNDALRPSTPVSASEESCNVPLSTQSLDNSTIDTHPTRSSPSPPSTPSPSTSGSSGHKSPPHLPTHTQTPVWDHLTTASRGALSSRNAILSFHARHIPQITLEAYLLRILKYCPTANTTFVAVLVYFDRMCKLTGNIEVERGLGSHARSTSEDSTEAQNISKGFTIDSFNIHRLVIAGVTVASKFFSDVFYTNSRYAKVGGLPQHELNQLELQFLLLNDFSLIVSPEELARYGAQLLTYAKNKGVDLVPEGLGKGKLSRDARIVLGLEEEPKKMPLDFLTIEEIEEQHRRNAQIMKEQNLTARSSHGPRNTMSSSSSGISDTIESEAEADISTDDEPTIRARSESETESSFSFGGTDTDASETEGEDDEDGVEIWRKKDRRALSSSSGSAPARHLTPGGTSLQRT